MKGHTDYRLIATDKMAATLTIEVLQSHDFASPITSTRLVLYTVTDFIHLLGETIFTLYYCKKESNLHVCNFVVQQRVKV